MRFENAKQTIIDCIAFSTYGATLTILATLPMWWDGIKGKWVALAYLALIVVASALAVAIYIVREVLRPILRVKYCEPSKLSANTLMLSKHRNIRLQYIDKIYKDGRNLYAIIYTERGI